MGQMMESWACTAPRSRGRQAGRGQGPHRQYDCNFRRHRVGHTGNARHARAAGQILVPAGTVSYAQLLTEANSDVPGPILAQIVSGPLAGARAVGSFEVSAAWADYLVLQFALADKDGHDYGINAVALDPDTSLGGMATEVDQRYFVRVVLPAASSFLQGVGSAIGQGNSSVVTNGTTTIVQQTDRGIKQGTYSGLGQAAQTAGQFFQNQANQARPLIRVAAGTPMGLFFITSVTDTAYTPPVPGYGPQGPGYGQGYGQAQPGQPGYNPLAAAMAMNPALAAMYGQQGMGMYGQPTMPGASLYPGMTMTGYGNQANASQGVPYPNYAAPGPSVSTPLSTVPSTGSIYTTH